MRRAWVYVVLAVSLALNAGAVGAVAYRRYARWRQERDFFRHIRPEPETRHRMSGMMKQHRVEMDSLRREFENARLALLELGLQDSVDNEVVEQLLDRIGSTYREMTLRVYETGRQIQEMHPEDKRRWLRRRMRRVIEAPRRHGRGRSRGRWHGHGSREGRFDPILPDEPPPVEEDTEQGN